MLARRLKGSDPREVLTIEKRACFARLHEVSQTRARAEKEGAPLHAILLLELAVLQLEAFLKWLERWEEFLKREKPR